MVPQDCQMLLLSGLDWFEVMLWGDFCTLIQTLLEIQLLLFIVYCNVKRAEIFASVNYLAFWIRLKWRLVFYEARQPFSVDFLLQIFVFFLKLLLKQFSGYFLWAYVRLIYKWLWLICRYGLGCCMHLQGSPRLSNHRVLLLLLLL